MNLDKLKELEAKATQDEANNWKGTPGEWVNISAVYEDVDVYTKNGGDHAMSEIDKKLVCELRSSAKEMIETIERYKTALEKAQKDLDEAMDYHTIESRAELLGDAIDDITLALKDPEKTTDPTKS